MVPSFDARRPVGKLGMQLGRHWATISSLDVLAIVTFVLGENEKKIPYLYRNPPAMRLFVPETSQSTPLLRLYIALNLPDLRMRCRQLDSIHAYHQLSILNAYADK